MWLDCFISRGVSITERSANCQSRIAHRDMMAVELGAANQPYDADNGQGPRWPDVLAVRPSGRHKIVLTLGPVVRR